MPEPGGLILLRHGESVLNAEDRFTGLLDVPLTARGEAGAATAAAVIADAGFRPDVAYVSILRRATRTSDIVLERLDAPPPRRVVTWRPMERNYGALTGMRRADVDAEYGHGSFLAWRRGRTDAPPPMTAAELRRLRAQSALAGVPPRALRPTEALTDVIRRVAVLWHNEIAEELRAGRNVLVIAHGNSLRALCTILDGLDDTDLADLNIPTGQPLLYTFDMRLETRPRRGHYLDPRAAEHAVDILSRSGGT